MKKNYEKTSIPSGELKSNNTIRNLRVDCNFHKCLLLFKTCILCMFMMTLCFFAATYLSNNFCILMFHTADIVLLSIGVLNSL